MSDWIQDHAFLLGTVSVAMFVASVLAVLFFVARLPADHFVRDDPPLARWRTRHPVVRWTLLGVKNLAGAVLLVAGVVMLVLPGQGLISILVALGLLDFPGKREVQLAILRRKPVRRVVAWIRRRAGEPPLRLPPRRSTRPS